jgi:hypothetical protein
MAIDKSGPYWKGSHLFDLYEYLEMVARFQKLLQVICNCGSCVFLIDYNFKRACVQTTCPNCRCENRLGDVEDWQNAGLNRFKCPCRADLFRIGLGIQMNQQGVPGWTILGQRCEACGTLTHSANCRETVPCGTAGRIGSFIDVKNAREILKAYQLQLYEVIYYGGAGDPEGADGRDAIYLVAAKDFGDARDSVDRNLYHWDRQGAKPLADVVQEIGINLTRDHATHILRGPYFATGYQFGWRVWRRTEQDEWVITRTTEADS